MGVKIADHVSFTLRFEDFFAAVDVSRRRTVKVFYGDFLVIYQINFDCLAFDGIVYGHFHEF